ncbi:glycoside hydrolase family 95 protein [Psychrosphaera sp. G1-22]|uniref:Glycoside hydrolase family 95 protein n=1 Tax=Psychrosphaera algicola TaxID=3023714 RepID=A0ABT5FBR4_9GAMM|nr:glycoside hydrolase family 95 protein [Psychrosphaera sp. G1-22]MDC2888991.1 glycoside hydrolase family 95 protein [Psychrosphaera sp. G1-22]
MKQLLLILSIFYAAAAFAEPAKNFDGSWYDKPAKGWEREALPIGNGYMGAMIFGKVGTEVIQFNEKTLWDGGKGMWADYQGGNYQGRAKYLKEVQSLFKAGKDQQASKLASKKLVGNQRAYGAYQNFGSLIIKTGHDQVTDYRRSLDFKKAEALVSYKDDNVIFTRTHFASYPDRLLVHRFEASQNASINLDIDFKSAQQLTKTKTIAGGFSYEGNVHGNKMKWQMRLIAVNNGGSRELVNGRIIIKGADSVVLYQVAATEYKQSYPEYKGTDYLAITEKAITKAVEKGYDNIRESHRTDHQTLYNRVKLNIAGKDNFTTPTNERIQNYKESRDDRGLEILLFNFGRYMMIASSRPGSLPANLQGVWNNSNNPQWTSDYHANINLQMNYWMAETTNLAETVTPLIEFIDSLREPGRVTAKEYYDAEGWVAHTMINTFGFTAPGWKFNWGYAPNAAAWLSRHTWEHYNFGRDKTYLQNTAYPILKEAVLFWEQYLTVDDDGTLVSSPSFSPEHGPITVGSTMDQQVAYDILSICIEAAEILEVDADKVTLWRNMRSRLSPLKIGKHGQLQEWKEDLDDPQDTHRHVNHLYGLHLGDK